MKLYDRIYDIQQAGIRFYSRYGMTILGQDNIPKDGGIIASTHLSFLDPVVIRLGLESFGKRIVFVSRRDHDFFSPGGVGRIEGERGIDVIKP